MATNSTTPVTVVGVNNGSVTTQASGGAGIKRVLITPLGQPGQLAPTQLAPPVIDEVLLKAVAKTGKKDKTFTLRHINMGKVYTCDELKKLIKKQLCSDVIAWEEFDIGYINSK